MLKQHIFTIGLLLVVGFLVAGPNAPTFGDSETELVGGDDCNHRFAIASTCTGSGICNQTLYLKPTESGVLNRLGTITPDYCNVIGCTADGRASVTNITDDCTTIIQ